MLFESDKPLTTLFFTKSLTSKNLAEAIFSLQWFTCHFFVCPFKRGMPAKKATDNCCIRGFFNSGGYC